MLRAQLSFLEGNLSHLPLFDAISHNFRVLVYLRCLPPTEITKWFKIKEWDEFTDAV